MREILIGEKSLSDTSGNAITCTYHILVRTILSPVMLESYGVRVAIAQTGEQEDVPDITVRADRIEALIRLLLRGGVTPCTLREVIEDWL